jgi:hypothetical protein
MHSIHSTHAILNTHSFNAIQYTQGIDTSSTDTKGTVLIKTAAELEGYSKGEENKLEEYIKSIADTGAKVGGRQGVSRWAVEKRRIAVFFFF